MPGLVSVVATVVRQETARGRRKMAEGRPLTLVAEEEEEEEEEEETGNVWHLLS